MGTPDPRVTGKITEPREGFLHLLRGSLKKPSATASKERVPAEEILSEPVRDMAGRVARSEDHLSGFPAERYPVSVIQEIGQPRNPAGIRGVSKNPEPGIPFRESGICSHMVRVVMGVEDRLKTPATFFEE